MSEVEGPENDDEGGLWGNNVTYRLGAACGHDRDLCSRRAARPVRTHAAPDLHPRAGGQDGTHTFTLGRHGRTAGAARGIADHLHRRLSMSARRSPPWAWTPPMPESAVVDGAETLTLTYGEALQETDRRCRTPASTRVRSISRW